jgi:Cu/Ag efflux pump CusA
MNHRKEAVEGIVLMRKYGNTLDTLAGVKAKVASLNASNIMPRGYRLVPFYDRTDLVETTLHTVLENLTIGMVLVFVVLVFFLGNIRSAVIAAVNIPLALLGAFTLMRLTDTPANLISLGAIDFGIIIDSTVIVVENINRHLTADTAAASELRGSILRASEEVGSPILFSTLIFMIAFLPLFTMRGVEGAIFSPMSHVRLCTRHRDSPGGVALASAQLVSDSQGHESVEEPDLGGASPPLSRALCARPCVAPPNTRAHSHGHRRRALPVPIARRRVSAEA